MTILPCECYLNPKFSLSYLSSHMLSPSVQESRSFTLHYILLTREKKKYFKIDTVATRKHCGKAPEDLHHMFPAQGQFNWKGSVVHESQN